jgi:hypothetical protein
MKTQKTSSVLMGLFLVLALASFGMTSPAAASANKIAVHAQNANFGQVMVDSVTAAQDGWLFIRQDNAGMPGRMLGYTPVHQGLNTNLTVDIRDTGDQGGDLVTATLWATLVPDDSALTPFSVPNPVIAEPGTDVFAVAFGSEPAGAPAPLAGQLPTTGGVSAAAAAPKANKISVQTQNANLGQVIVDSVTATQDGWLFIREDNNGMPGRMLGYTPVHQGLNTNLGVDIRTTGDQGGDLISATLWATLVPDDSALTPFAVPNPVISEQGTDVFAVPFGGE